MKNNDLEEAKNEIIKKWKRCTPTTVISVSLTDKTLTMLDELVRHMSSNRSYEIRRLIIDEYNRRRGCEYDGNNRQ